MIRVLKERQKEILDLLSNPMPFESTFQIPIEELPRFVSTILAPFEFHQATISTFEVVFEPERTLEMLAGQQIDLENKWEFNLKAEGREHCEIVRSIALRLD